MNERIKELEAQCWEHDQSWTGVGQRVFNREKFAELIVREYGNIVLHYTDVDEGVRVANKHFGVEE